MRDILQTFVSIDFETKRVGNLPAVIQHSSSLQRSDKISTQRMRIKHRVPLHPSTNSREHATVSRNMQERQSKSPWSTAVTRRCLRAAGDEAPVGPAQRTGGQ